MASNLTNSVGDFIRNAEIIKLFVEGGVEDIPKIGIRTLEYYTRLIETGMAHYVAGIAYETGQFAFTVAAGGLKVWQANEDIAVSTPALDQTKWSEISVSSEQVEVTAYATNALGTTGRLHSLLQNGRYRAPSNLGKTHQGTAIVPRGAAVPITAAAYSWKEIPDRQRHVLVDFGSTGTGVSGTKTLAANYTDFEYLEFLWWDTFARASGTARVGLSHFSTTSGFDQLEIKSTQRDGGLFAWPGATTMQIIISSASAAGYNLRRITGIK